MFLVQFDPDLLKKRYQLLHDAAEKLDKAHMIRYVQGTKPATFHATDLGRIATSTILQLRWFPVCIYVCVCMCACVRACMRACVRAIVHTCVSILVCVLVCVCMCVYICAFAHACVWCVHVCTIACMCVSPGV